MSNTDKPFFEGPAWASALIVCVAIIVSGWMVSSMAQCASDIRENTARVEIEQAKKGMVIR